MSLVSRSVKKDRTLKGYFLQRIVSNNMIQGELKNIQGRLHADYNVL